MATLQHVYLTLHGMWTDPHWVNETAQMGLRLAIEPSSSEPDRGRFFTMRENGEVVPDAGTQAGANGVLTRTWTARLGPAGNDENADKDWQTDLADDFYAFANTIKANITTKFKFTHVKIAPIDAQGKYAAPGAIYTFNTAVTGTVAGSPMPPEVAVALTLRAPVIGRRGRGRMYVPGQSTACVAADGTTNPAYQTAYKNALVTLISDLENAPGTEGYGPLVVVTSAGKPDAIRPTMVRVGSHVDVQRRRQHQATETYSDAAIG